MTTEAEGDTNPLQEVSDSFTAGYVSTVMCEVVDEIRNGIDYRFRRITKLLLDLPVLHPSSSERSIAERDIFRLQTEIEELTGELHNTLTTAPNLGLPVALIHP